MMPVSSRVVCLNAPYLKSLCIFEALSRTLGCYYNHHRPQVVSCQGMVRLPAPRIVRIRGHASHAHTPTDTPMLQTTLKMGTYLVFHFTDWTRVHQCHLILNGIEKVPRTEVPPKIILERINGVYTTPSQQFYEGHMETNGSITDIASEREVNPSPLLDTSIKKVGNKPSRFSKPTAEISKKNLRHCINQDNQTGVQVNNKVQSVNNSNEPEEHKEISHHIFLDMNKTEEVTTLLDDDEDEFASDTSDDLHKVVRKRLSTDITPLLNPHPKDNVLILLLRPAEETQAWQFLSSCLQVTQSSSKTMVMDGSGTIKKALTRTKPLYFSKNGNVHRI